MSKSPIVSVICSCYNHSNYVVESLKAVKNQTYKNIKLWISDDNSTDGTKDILKEYQDEYGKERIAIINNAQTKETGFQSGCVRNFLSITCNKNIKADFYAYSDQDDIWKEDKIERAIKSLQDYDNKIPLLYGTRTELIDENEKFIGFSPLFKKAPSFKNALVQSIAGGNTMLFNDNAMSLLRAAGMVKIISHDWWAYILISGAGGKVIYDEIPSLYYRQHGKNIIGSNNGVIAKCKRIAMLFKGNYKQWNQSNVNALSTVKHLLTEDNLSTLIKFIKTQNSGLLTRLLKFFSSGVYRQTIDGNIALLIGVIFNKI